MDKTEEELIKDGWHPVQTPSYHPCANCEFGFISTGQMTSANGKLFTKTESCHDKCKILADFNALHKQEKT